MWSKTSASLGRISRAFLSLVTELWTGTMGQGELLWLGKVWVPSSHLHSNGEDGWRSVHLAVLDPFYLFGPSEEVNGCRPVCFVGDTPFSGSAVLFPPAARWLSSCRLHFPGTDWDCSGCCTGAPSSAGHRRLRETEE